MVIAIQCPNCNLTNEDTGLRKAQGYESTRVFAEAVGVSNGTITNWENEHTWPTTQRQVKEILIKIGISLERVEATIQRNAETALEFALNRETLTTRIIDSVSQASESDMYEWKKGFFNSTEQQVLCSLALDANDGDNQARKLYLEERDKQRAAERSRESGQSH